MMAEAKTARQADRDDHPEMTVAGMSGYSWPRPEQTIEWEAAAEITRLTALTAPSTPAGDGMVEVVQADRDAAANMKSAVAESWCNDCDRIVEGRFDDWPIVQAFARHRLQALAPATVEEPNNDK